VVIVVERMVTQAHREIVGSLGDMVKEHGLSPIVRQTKQALGQVVGYQDDLPPSGLASLPPDDLYFRRYTWMLQREFRHSWELDERIPDDGELFLTPKGGVLYIITSRIQRDKTKRMLEIGYVGPQVSGSTPLKQFAELVAKALASEGHGAIAWKEVRRTSKQFDELVESEETKSLNVSSITKRDLEHAALLEDQATRELALTVRRAANILMVDLKRKVADDQRPDQLLSSLVNVGLCTREYVVICSKTSNQVNRVKDREALSNLARLGVRCSCGRPLDQERLEEVYAQTEALQRMLDKSYWATVKLANTLVELGVSEKHILLNLQDGNEEVDAFVDIDGTLVMIEIKDSEYSMGHAYAFTGRIGLYKPDYAIMVSTKQVADEVKEYFKKANPQAKIIYVDGLSELSQSLETVIQSIRSERALHILTLFDLILSSSLRLSLFLGQKLGLEISPSSSVKRRGLL